jgi:signal transduction histidine kinase
VIGNGLRIRQWIALVALSFIVVLTTVALVALSAYRAVERANRSLVDVVDPSQAASLRLGNAFVGQETAVRDFALSAQPASLSTYQSSVNGARKAEAELRDAYQDASNGAFRARLVDDLAVINDAASQWQTNYVTPTIANARANGPNPSGGQVVAEAQRQFAPLAGALSKQQRDLEVERQDARSTLSQRSVVFDWSVLACAVLLLLSIAAVGWALRRFVTAPVARLTSGVREVADGAFEHPVGVEGPVEIRGLAQDVDGMRRRIVAELAESTAARQRLDEQAEELRRSNAELEQFAYVASHDLQEPLRKVASFCQLLERRYGQQLDERGHAYIEFAVDGAKRMQALINDLLTFSRVGRRGAGVQNVSIPRVIEQAKDSLTAVIDDTNATIEAENLPDVHADPVLMRQLFQNLISNALKFHGDEPPYVRITARPSPTGERSREGADAGRPMIEFTCSDNGIGVDPEYADRIFVIFQRLHTKEAYPGTGIGLALCKKIVEYHGGRIWLEDPGRGQGEGLASGATFRFTLPAADPAEKPSSGEQDQEPRTNGAAGDSAPSSPGEVP